LGKDLEIFHAPEERKRGTMFGGPNGEKENREAKFPKGPIYLTYKGRRGKRKGGRGKNQSFPCWHRG